MQNTSFGASEGKIFVFIICLKLIFLGIIKFGVTKNWGRTAHKCPRGYGSAASYFYFDSFPEMNGYMFFKSNPKFIFQDPMQIRKPKFV